MFGLKCFERSPADGVKYDTKNDRFFRFLIEIEVDGDEFRIRLISYMCFIFSFSYAFYINEPCSVRLAVERIKEYAEGLKIKFSS